MSIHKLRMLFENFIQNKIEQETIELELQRGFAWYRLLSANLKSRFVQRVDVFLQAKRFVGRKDLQVSDSMRVITSAFAVQITFGLEHYLLPAFEYVVLYPDVYESPVTHQLHRGETNLSGFICLSWKHLQQKLEKEDDNLNLGIHEWAHALRFNSFKGETTDYFFESYINKWVACASKEFNQLKACKPSIFRKYGGTNIHEFFSVVVEHFFESPDEFKEKANALWLQMCILLNQVDVKGLSTNFNTH